MTIGQVLKPQGIRGELKVKPYTDDINRFRVLREVYIDGVKYKVLRARVLPSEVYITLGGIIDRNTAENYRDKFICVDRENAVELEDGNYFIVDVLGSTLITDTGKEIGIVSDITKSNVDIYTFVNYSSSSDGAADNEGEFCIYELPDLSTFDGVILLANTINLASERKYLRDQIIKNNLPAVSLEYPMDDIPYLYTNTYSGVYALTTHLTQTHNVRNVVYISAPADNSENITRKKAVVDALAQVGATLPEENILYGNWSYYDTFAVMGSYFDAGRPLPDAFVCANDEMAIAVCAFLHEKGIRVPEQVLVTGCDCTKRSQEIYPILSTVVREWDQLGHDSLDLVLKQMDGIAVPASTWRKLWL